MNSMKAHTAMMVGIGLALASGTGSSTPRAAAPVEYTIVELGTLGGGQSRVDIPRHTMNAAGYIVGSSDVLGPPPASHAFLWGDGVMIDLGTLGGRNSIATGINDPGQVVGNSGLSGERAEHAFLWTDGQMNDLGTLGGTQSVAYGINDAGQVVGTSKLSGDRIYHGFVWDPETGMRDLGTLAGTRDSEAYGINAAGQIFGRAFFDDGRDPVNIAWTPSAK